MGREFDIREEARAQPAELGVESLERNADAVSQELPGSHEVAVEATDPVTGRANTIVSRGAEPAQDDLVAAAIEHVRAISPVLGFARAAPPEFRAPDGVVETSSGAAAVHLQQTLEGIAIFQAGQTVRFDSEKAIEASSGYSSDPAEAPSAEPSITAADAVTAVARYLAEAGESEEDEDQFGEPVSEQPFDAGSVKPTVAKSEDDPERHTWLQAPPLEDPVTANLTWFDLNGSLRLGWEVNAGLPGFERYRVIVDAGDGRVLYSRCLTLGVLARGEVFLPDGGSSRKPHDFPLALGSYPVQASDGLPSPFPREDWVAADRTEGNNVCAHLPDGTTAAGSSVDGLMTFGPADEAGDDQLRLNVFFLCNFMHDFLYLLGFREADGNFQLDNGDLGGSAGDHVDAFVHPGSVQGTANMLTLEDGTAPVMNMGLVTSTNRHTALDSSVVFHEYAHGLSNRLVGGPNDDRSLEAIQSRSMGEGWSDYIACTINQTAVVGAWVVGKPGGIRGFTYDAAFPDHFGMLGSGRYTKVHNNGEIWCAALMELNRNIGEKLAIEIVIDGMKLTPANPTYLQARDAILSALDAKAVADEWDEALRAERKDQAWRAFAKYGMGVDAQSGPATGYAGIAAGFSTS
ncbi:MAG TPA: M36 family metallopeptidase [Solirubrobacterales bacterium]